MSDDLVKRLRNRADRCMKYGYEEHSKIDTEAADRIEELEKAFTETIIAFDKALYSGELDMKFSAYCMTIQDSNKRIVGMKKDD